MPTSALVQSLQMTVLAAMDEAASTLTLENAFIDRIWWNTKPRVAQAYQTVRITVPTVNRGNVVDIGNGPIQPSPYTGFTKDITLNHKFSDSYTVQSFDQATIQIDLQETFFPPRFEEILQTVNESIIIQINTTNFGTGTTPPGQALFTGTGTVANQITRADISKAWTNLRKIGVPMNNSNNISLMTSSDVMGQWFADTAFSQVINVGETAAINAQQRAIMANMLGAMPFDDQMLLPFNAGHAPAVLLHRYAISGVTASEPAPIAGAPFSEVYYRLRGLPIRVQIGQSMYDQGIVIHFSLLCGIAVTRPEMAQLFQSAS